MLTFANRKPSKRITMSILNNPVLEEKLSFEEFQTEVLNDYRIAVESREVSLVGRKEVLTGKAKFGIFGDGKEVAQIAMAKAFRLGDIRSGYYRDQTLMFATGMSDATKFFSQLYADTNIENEPSSAGRQMNSHFSSQFLDEEGNWKNLLDEKHSTADVSPTAGQMGRALGIAYASKLYRNNSEMKDLNFSRNGNEISFCTIGNASCSEGHFWEVVNGAGVLQVPLLISIWDDEYGISVPAKYQTTKENLSEILSGFETNDKGKAFKIYKVKGWDYPALIETYLEAAEHTRHNHMPAIVHVSELTQPQGHSTSGSHERYKSKDRLTWEKNNDCLVKMRQWVLSNGIAREEELDALEENAASYARNCRKKAWALYRTPIEADRKWVLEKLDELIEESANGIFVGKVRDELKSETTGGRREIVKAVRQSLRITRGEQGKVRQELIDYRKQEKENNYNRFSSKLYSDSPIALSKLAEIAPLYSNEAEVVNGFELLNACFRENFKKYPKLFAIGEDLGKIGDVNQGFRGMQDEFGEGRVTDTGIREMSIIGQGIGASMRGLRPIVEIQYLDYVLYAIQIMSDDLATLQYRTKGTQKAPLIVRTRGHRLEGIWHSGSPMGMIINALRGINILVPRNMTQAAGMYNAALKSDEPVLLVECLNAYRLKEKLPSNITEFTVKPGYPEVILEGEDVTLVTYGSSCRVAQEAAAQLRETGISIEIIDVQSLLPFDIGHSIVESIKKTNKVIFVDEDVPGGATAYMMQKVMEEQGAWVHMDSLPKTLSSRAHRPAYASDGDYFSKPSAEDMVDTVYEIMNEYNPAEFPSYK